MLPNFLIVGAQKAATTWLSVCLAEHPDILMAKKKETYFFNVHFDKGLEWYKDYFDDWAGQTAIGEATPGYLSHPDVPRRIKTSLGKAKLLASLRHPVDRAYSAFWHYIRGGQIPPDTDFYTFFQQDSRFELRSRGFYASQLNRYLEYFAPEDLLILVYEEIFKDSQKTVIDCLDFLEVDSNFIPSNLSSKVHSGSKDISAFHTQVRSLRLILRKILLKNTGNKLLSQNFQKSALNKGRQLFNKLAFDWGPKKKSFEKLNIDTQQEILAKYYMSDIKKLEDLLNKDLSIWYAS